jgi:ubiquinone/menaquinone biosynthesis C-methylase UbiE
MMQSLGLFEELAGFCLDLGGGGGKFTALLQDFDLKHVLVDLNPRAAVAAQQNHPGLLVVIANGEQLPFADQSVDLTICNSVIEHVANQERLASEIDRTSKRFFVQTPNGDFPIETHSFVGIPFYRSVPWTAWRRALCRIFSANFVYIESVRYLSEETLTRLFPRAMLARERWLGLVKSYYVYATGTTDERRSAD